MSLQTHGHCPNCHEYNTYDRTHCHHCNEVLAWAFLINPALDVPNEEPSLWSRITGKEDKPKTKHKVPCRYCQEPIPYDAKVCFHCRELLFRGDKWSYGSASLDSDAPFLRILINAYIARHEPA